MFYIMIRIFYCNSHSNAIPEEISEYRKDKLFSTKTHEDRIGKINAAKVLKAGFAELGINEKDIVYAVSQNGKPYAENFPSVHFSLAHSKAFSLVAFSENEIGIDCEDNQRIVPNEIIYRFFTKSEADAFKTAPLTLWSAKEAFVKHTGKGFATGRNEIELPYFENELILNGLWFKKLDIEEHTVVLCTGKQDELTVKKVL